MQRPGEPGHGLPRGETTPMPGKRAQAHTVPLPLMAKEWVLGGLFANIGLSATAATPDVAFRGFCNVNVNL